MKKSDAVKIVNNAIVAFQRFRSIVIESAEKDGVASSTLAILHPWTLGSKCPLITMQRVVDSDSLTGGNLYNFMVVLDRFAPEVKVVSDFDFPAPNPLWVTEEWSAEQ